MKKHGPQKNVDWYAALILGFAAAFSLPIAGLSYMGVLFCLGVMMGVARKISYRFAAVSSVSDPVGAGRGGNLHLRDLCKYHCRYFGGGAQRGGDLFYGEADAVDPARGQA